MSSDDPMTVTENWVHMEKDMYRSAPLMSFTQKDVDEGNIWYRDLGGQDQVEAFRFQVTTSFKLYMSILYIPLF